MATAKQKAEVEGYIQKWQPLLFLQQWHFTLDFPTKGKDQLLAEIDCRPRYFEADVTIFPKYWEDGQDAAYRERTLLHEMAHAVVAEFSDLADARHASQDALTAANERLTETITSIAFYANQNPPKRKTRKR